jgi:hypothetical protein
MNFYGVESCFFDILENETTSTANRGCLTEEIWEDLHWERDTPILLFPGFLRNTFAEKING